MIASSGFQDAFFFFGVLQGSVIFAVAWFLRSPKRDEVRHSTKVAQSRRDYTLGEALRTPVFYVMMAMFILTVTGGLMAVAQLGLIAQDLGVKEFPVNLYFFTMAALPFALMLDRIMNGLSRPIFGWISDHIGREKTMFIAFSMEGIGIIALGYFGHNPYAFLILSGVVFLAWGEVYSPLQRHGRRHLRHQACRQDLWRAVLRQGSRGPAGPRRQPADGSHRHMVNRPLHRRRHGSLLGGLRRHDPSPDAGPPPRPECRRNADRRSRTGPAGQYGNHLIPQSTRRPVSRDFKLHQAAAERQRLFLTI